MNRIQMIHREPARQLDAMHPFGVRAAQEALAFHCSMPGYCETPLFSLRALARALGVASIHVKDESQRFDLNAFKVLGGSFCISRILAERFDLPKADFAALTQPELRAAIRGITFVTATDGNHGRGVAWTATAWAVAAWSICPEAVPASGWKTSARSARTPPLPI